MLVWNLTIDLVELPRLRVENCQNLSKFARKFVENCHKFVEIGLVDVVVELDVDLGHVVVVVDG